MKISACVGFGRAAATTRQIDYMKEQAGRGFTVYNFEGRGKIAGMVHLFRNLMKDDSDAILIVKASPYTGLPAIAAGILRRKKKVVLLDDYEKAITTERHGKIMGSIMGLAEKMVIALSDGVIAASEFMYEKAGSKRKKLIPFGIPEKRFAGSKSIRKELGLKKSDRVLVYVGSLTKNADADIAIEAMQGIAKKVRSAKLLIVGGGESIDGFRELAIRKGVSDSVVFCGSVPFGKVPDYIKSSDLCLIPMRDTPIDKGRCPMKLLEYIASGKPVAGGRAGMVKYFLPDEFTCEPGSSEELAKKACQILSSESMKKRWKAKAAELASKYSLKNMWGQSYGFISSVAGK